MRLVRVLNQNCLVRSISIKVSCSLLKESSFVIIVESVPKNEWPVATNGNPWTLEQNHRWIKCKGHERKSKWSPIKETSDCQTNSPCHYRRKFKENSVDNFNTFVGVLRVKRPEILWFFFFVSLLFTLLLSRSTHCNGRWTMRGKTAGGCPARLKVWWSHTQSYRKLWNGFKLKWDRKTARLIYFGGISECCLRYLKDPFILHKFFLSSADGNKYDVTLPGNFIISRKGHASFQG